MGRGAAIATVWVHQCGLDGTSGGLATKSAGQLRELVRLHGDEHLNLIVAVEGGLGGSELLAAQQQVAAAPLEPDVNGSQCRLVPSKSAVSLPMGVAEKDLSVTVGQHAGFTPHSLVHNGTNWRKRSRHGTAASQSRKPNLPALAQGGTIHAPDTARGSSPPLPAHALRRGAARRSCLVPDAQAEEVDRAYRRLYEAAADTLGDEERKTG